MKTKHDYQGYCIILGFIIWLAVAIYYIVNGDIANWFTQPIHLNIK